MDIKFFKINAVIIGLLVLLSLHCKKRNESCPKQGYEYVHTTSHCSYSPGTDSIPVGTVIKLEASVPKTFIDEVSNAKLYNNSPVIEGPLHVVMLYPLKQEAIENFKINAETGMVIKDSIEDSETLLKGFRTLRWDGSGPDSFKITVLIQPEIRGVYTMALGQQGYRDSDCALYKYFLNVENDQHLYYLAQYNNGYVGDYDSSYAYCFKVY